MYIVNSSSIVERRNTEKNINNETYMEKKQSYCCLYFKYNKNQYILK